MDKDSEYEIWFTDQFSGVESFNNLRKLNEGVIKYPGYHTVELNEESPLTADSKVAVAIKLKSNNISKPLAIESPEGIGANTAKANSGESYVKTSDYGNWTDLTSLENNSNACLKIFTNNGSNIALEDISLSDNDITLSVGEKSALEVVYKPANVTNKYVTWSSSNPDIVSVDNSGNIRGLKVGKAQITVKSAEITKTCSVTVSDSVNEELFPDDELETVIRSTINKPTGKLEISDLEGITTLNANDKDIISIEGLQYLKNLQGLYLNKNHITDLTPISCLTKLETLYLDSNNVSDLSPLSGLSNLQHVWFENNDISDISPIRYCTKLYFAVFAHNKIEDISAVANLTNLSVLDFWDNKVMDISALANLTNLERLYLPQNNISDISPLKYLVNLKELVLNSNPITDYSPTADYYNNLTNKDFSLN